MMNDLKKDFPFFKNQPSCIYFDSAATAQRPYKVLEAVEQYYSGYNSNIGRGVYNSAEKATKAYEDVRLKIGQFINAEPETIIFIHGATDGINLVAHGLKHCIQPGDEIVVTQLEHHSNFVPWQRLAEETGAHLRVIPVTKEGQLESSVFDKFITEKTKVVAVTHVSNALGVLNTELDAIVKKAHAVGARVLVDGAQYVGYQQLDVQKLGCDFYVFSGHKMLGPTGCGVLYVKPEAQKDLRPTSFGGGAIEQVNEQKTTLAHFPHSFEPGTPPIAQIIGLGAAVEYLESIGLETIHTHTVALTRQFLEEVSSLKHVHVIGPREHLKTHAHSVSFTVDTMHAHDIAAFLNSKGICVRAGHHCAQPLAKALGYEASVRISFHLYNDAQEVSFLIKCLQLLAE